MTSLQKTSGINIKVDSDNIGLSNAALVSTFLKDGVTKRSCHTNITKTKEEIKSFLYDLIAPVAGTKLTSVVEDKDASFGGIVHSDSEYMSIRIQETPEFSTLSVEGFLSFANNEKLSQFLNNNSYVAPRRPGVYSVTIYHYYLDKLGATRKINHYKTTESFKDIRDDLYPKVNVPLLMKMYAESSENNLILTGSPGTGKTCFVKKCLRDLALEKQRDIRVVYVKDRELLKRDEFWAKLATERPEVLVLDDLDDELLPRTEGRNDIVNNMLSFSDGLFDVSTKIIITTNQPNTAIDKALIRPGRCFDILALPNLTWEEALHVWLNGFEEKQESFAKIFGTNSDKMVSQAALVSEYQRFKKEGEAPYLLDSSISIRTTVEDGGVANL